MHRSTELYLNLDDNSRLDSNGFTPVGWVVSGMDHVVTDIYDGYGEMQDICSLHGATPCDGPFGEPLSCYLLLAAAASLKGQLVNLLICNNLLVCR